MEDSHCSEPEFQVVLETGGKPRGSGFGTNPQTRESGNEVKAVFTRIELFDLKPILEPDWDSDCGTACTDDYFPPLTSHIIEALEDRR